MNNPVSVVVSDFDFIKQLPIDLKEVKLPQQTNIYDYIFSIFQQIRTIGKGATLIVPLTAPLRPQQYQKTFNYSLGIRILNHPFQQFIQKLQKMFITTSLNIAGQPTINDPKQIPNELANQIDWIIVDKPLNNPPSVIVDLKTGKIINR